MRQHIEDNIQEAVANHLRVRALPGVLWWHTPNGGKRPPRTAARLKRMGVLAGVSDIIAFHNKEMFAMELKAPKGVPTQTQKDFMASWRANGGQTYVAIGVDDALSALKCWGLIR